MTFGDEKPKTANERKSRRDFEQSTDRGELAGTVGDSGYLGRREEAEVYGHQRHEG